MKSLLHLVFFSVAVGTALAQPTSAPASSSGPTPASGELLALERFLSLSDDELAQMANAIARVREMTPVQRAAMRDEIAAFRQLPAPQRAQIRQGWGWMPAEIQNGWREMMQHASPEERAAIQARLQSLPPDEKLKYRRDLVDAYLKAKPQTK